MQTPEEFKEWCIKQVQSKIRNLAFDGVISEGLPTPEILEVIETEIAEIRSELEPETEYKDQ